MIRSHGRPSGARDAGRSRPARRRTARRSGRYDSAVSRYGSPSPTTRISAGAVGRHDGPRPVVDGQVVRGGRHGRVAADEPDLDDRDVGRHVVDDDIGPGLGLEGDVAGLEQPVVAPQLEPAVRPLDVEVGDADEDRPRDRATARSGPRAPRSPGCGARARPGGP